MTDPAADPEFDYVIVGGGSAGCVLASRLTQDDSVNVCLVEAGPVDSGAMIHCPAGFSMMSKARHRASLSFETVPQPGLGGRRGYQPRGRGLGGSSSVNAMCYVRGQPQDYDGWAAEGNDGWAWSDVLPLFRRSEHNERGDDAWHGSGGPLNVMDLPNANRFGGIFVDAAVQAGYPANRDFNGASQEGFGLYQVTQKGGERCSAAKAYLTPHLARANLHVMTDTQTSRIALEGRRAVGVEVRRGGTSQLLRARHEVVLCAGALQSPPLLMHSGIGDGEQLRRFGIEVRHHLPGVGRHLHDHVDVVQVVDAPDLRELFGLSLGGAFAAMKGVAEWRNKRSGLLTTNFAEAGGFIRSGDDAARPDLQFHFVIAKLVDHGRKTVFGHGYSAHVCLLRPNSRGSVALASADPRAAPLIDPAFLAEREDMERMVRGFKAMRRILAQPALADRGGRELQVSATARSDAEIEAFIRSRADTIYHPVGSCRMGSGPLDVVDARLRVHGIERLRVVDASVMPSIVSGNTNAPTIMIAEKASDLISHHRKEIAR
ncbi:MAG: choline dehydrogenase [Caldimonas sp.]